MGNSGTTERPVASFAISLVAGVLILGGSGMVMGLSSGAPYYGGMMGGYYGGMMGGYYGMMHGFGAANGWFYGLAALGIISGIAILIGAIMAYNQPNKAPTWGAVILAFSIASLFGMGGFYLGAVLGIVGGLLALTWKG